jgi:prophage regulatory protein
LEQAMSTSVPQNRRFLRLPEVMARTGLSRASIYRLGAIGKFPQRIKLSENCSAWDERELNAFLDERVAATRGTPGSTGSTNQPPPPARIAENVLTCDGLVDLPPRQSPLAAGKRGSTKTRE